MFKVNNKKMINQLVKSSLKAYKMRNVFTLITIILSVSLIAGLAFMCSAIRETQVKEMAKRQHVIYHQVDDAQIQSLKGEPQISLSKAIKKGQSFEKDDYIIIPYYIEQNDAPMGQLEILEGQYPQQMDEVLVYDQMLIKMGIAPKVGQSLSLTYLDGTTETYVVSGLLSAETSDVFSVYFSEAYARNGSQLREIPFDLTAQVLGAADMKEEVFLETIREIGKQYGVARRHINENNAFVRMLSYSTEEVMMVGLAACGILLVSVLVIYSIFYISISERTRQFGQLRTIGMTSRQVRKMVRKEGTVLSLIGTTIGIAIGALFAFCMQPKGFKVSNFIGYSVLILLANYITVQLSIAKPAKIASQTSPIEASRVSGYEAKMQQVMSSRLHRKLSPLSLSMIAARGNRKKSTMTMISLCLGGIVFMCASSFVNAVDEEQFSRQSWFEFGEYTLQLSSNAVKVNAHGATGIKVNNPLSEALRADLEAIDGVKEVIPMQTLEVTYSYADLIDQDVAAPFTVDDVALLTQYLKEGRIDYEQMIQNKEIIIVHNEMVKEIFGWSFKLGDQVTLQWFDGEKEREDTFTIGGILEPTRTLYKDPNMFKLAYNTGWFMLPEALLQQMMVPGFNLNSRMIVSCDDYWSSEAQIEAKIFELTENNPLLTVSTLKSSMDHHQDQFHRIYATFMGAALFVIAFSIINLLNTLISNTMARRKEFACLGAIGATNQQIKTMILGEGLYFAVINIVVTLTLGTLSGYMLVAFAQWNGVGYLVYQLPWRECLGYGTFVLVGTMILSIMISKIMNKKSLVERLREIE